MKRTFTLIVLSIVLAGCPQPGKDAVGQEGAAPEKPAAAPAQVPPYEAGGINVFTKVDFDAVNPFEDENSGKVSLEDKPEQVVSGKCLHVTRKQPTDYFGAKTKVDASGSKDLKIGFIARAKNMQTLALNVFDQIKKDNTTPATPARLKDDEWLPVLFGVEDFWYNGMQPEDKVKANVKYTELFFHGVETKAGAGEYWIDNFIIYRGHDTQAPTPPTNVKAKAVEAGGVELTWTAATDNAFPAVYSVFRQVREKWEKVGESCPVRFVDQYAPGGKQVYRVTAADFENNCSEPSKEAEVTAKAGELVRKVPGPQEVDRLGYAENVRKIHAAARLSSPKSGAGKVRPDVFLFAGDSITAANAYTYTLGQWLARGLTVRQGVGQMQTDFGKNQIKGYLEGAKPEFAVVMYGTNDNKDAKSIDSARENLSAVIDACAAFGTIPILATIPPRGADKDKQAGETAFNEMVVKLCQEKKVPASYCFQEMMTHELKEMLSDGVHLTPGPGNDAAGTALRKTLSQVYWALRDTSAAWK